MSCLIRAIPAFALFCLAAPSGSAALFFHTHGSNDSKITLRKRLHVNTLITAPGTMEADWSNLYSFSTADFSMPSAIKYTPEGTHVLWGRTEYSAAFDTVTSAEVGGARLTQFSQMLTLTATAVVHDGEKLDIAIAPQAAFFLRDEAGARLGAIAIARYDTGRNSIGGTFGWSGATNSSNANPAGTFGAGFGYGRQLAGSSLLEKFTPHFNMEWEKSTGEPQGWIAFEGIEYQMTEHVAFDLSALQASVPDGSADRQIVFGMTINFGRFR